jgi:hypothetical protein
MKRKVIFKRRSRLKYLAEKLEQCDREKAFLARIPCELERARMPKPEGLVPKKLLPHFTKDQLETLAETAVIDKMIPQPEPAAPSDFEFWRSYRLRFMAEEEKNARNIAPRGDVVETLLAQQMAALHRKCMDYLGREGLGEQDAMNFALRCMRVFSGQVEALKLWRSKGAQTMTVKHINNVNVGGQAIMGEITASPRGVENFEQ